MTTGLCRNAACANAREAKPIDRYPGPGEYCPECGAALEPVAAASGTTAAANAAPFGGLTALEALARFDAGPDPEDDAAPAPRPRKRTRAALVAAPVAVALIAGIALLRPSAAQRPGALQGPATAGAVHVCGSTLTERLAADVVRAYAGKAGIAPARFDLTHGGPCDVRFAVRRTAPQRDIVGRDGMVVVVNPQHPLTRMTADDVRLIFSGAITNWAEFGEPPGRIVAYVPADASDETQALARTLLAHAPLGAHVRRLASSADVVRAVVRADGRGAIGLVAFSAAVPAKVIALAPLVPPSSLSIGNGRYALSAALTVESASRPPAAAGLAAYARSDDAQAIVLRDGFVPKKGL